MARLKVERWTLVQHSAYGYQEKPGWEKAVETKMISTGKELVDVTNEGGLVLESYNEADEREMQENYPDLAGAALTYPRVKGTFSNKTLDGLRIYVPAKD